VLYSVPRKLVPEGEAFEDLREFAFEPSTLNTTILKAEPDLLLMEQWGLATHLDDTSLPVVVDLHGSLILENAFRQHRSLTSNAAAKLKSLRKADLVLCPGYRQRAYFMAWMLMSGSDPTDLPVEVVPVSMPPDMPERTADYDGPLSLVYGGQLWPWIHSGPSLQAAVEVLEETGAGTLDLFVKEPAKVDLLPYDDSTRIPSARLPERVTGSEVVRQEGLIAHEEMVARYAGAHLAVDLYGWNSERELAFTTRTVEYLWCGLPVIYGDYGELASLIREYEAGWTVDPDDTDAVKAVVREAVGDREELQRRSENARRLVRERLSQDTTIEPLERFVQDPVVRTKGETIFGRLALEFERLKSEALDRMAPLQENLDHFKGEVARRDARILSLTDELARRERQAEETDAGYNGRLEKERAERDRVAAMLEQSRVELGRQAVEVDKRERELREVKAVVAERDETIVALQEKLARSGAMWEAEQRDHGQTVARAESLRQELTVSKANLARTEEDLDQMKVDLKAALGRIANMEEAFEERRESLEQEVRTLKANELELRKDLAAEAAEVQRLEGEVQARDQSCDQLKEEVTGLKRQNHELNNSWMERAVATGQFTLRRAAVQVPAVAGLWVRNLANNAYMTVWQKRNNVRIFPGQ